MKIKIKVTNHPGSPNVCLSWQLAGQPHATSFYILPQELTIAKYPHIISDCGRIASFWGDRFVMNDSVTNLSANAGCYETMAQVIPCNTYKLMAVLRTLRERNVPETIVDCDALTVTVEPKAYSIVQLARHENLKNPECFGATLKHFRTGLVNSKRTFQDLLHDLSRFIDRAHIFAMGDEFYFNGRYDGGMGFNGGIILHQNDYGIHT